MAIVIACLECYGIPNLLVQHLCTQGSLDGVFEYAYCTRFPFFPFIIRQRPIDIAYNITSGENATYERCH